MGKTYFPDLPGIFHVIYHAIRLKSSDFCALPFPRMCPSDIHVQRSSWGMRMVLRQTHALHGDGEPDTDEQAATRSLYSLYQWDWISVRDLHLPLHDLRGRWIQFQMPTGVGRRYVTDDGVHRCILCWWPITRLHVYPFHARCHTRLRMRELRARRALEAARRDALEAARMDRFNRVVEIDL